MRLSETGKINKYPKITGWWEMLKQKCNENRINTNQLISVNTIPMNYYTAFSEVRC